tara:strand:+ start:447 stop:1076 length:630 start_codon:yes stop_codon:yes gene_type:complete
MVDQFEELLGFAEKVRGFMPRDEGLALYDHALAVEINGPFLEIGSYCGKSAVYLGAAARQKNQLLFAVDHHRGSEENQVGWEWHDPDLLDPSSGLIDTLPEFRRTIFTAGLEENVIAVVGDSSVISSVWKTPLALLFIDGGHGTEFAHADYEGWVPHLMVGGTLLIHDVFSNPDDGGQPPFEIFQRAVTSGEFCEVAEVGSLRVLKRIV